MIARFSRGGSRFDLSSYPYGVDFIPPMAAFSYNIATGGASNSYGGGELIGEKAETIGFAIKLRILGTSAGAINAARASLAAFLKVDGPDPLYFEFCPYDVPETLWGQGLYRWEVITADVGLGAEYGDAKLRESGITVSVALTVSSVVQGKKQIAMSASGGVWMDKLGSAGGIPRGIRIPEAWTNKGLNPVFSHATWYNGWTAGASLTWRKNIDTRYTFPGSATSAFLTALASTNNTFTESITAGNTNVHSLAGLFYRPDGAAVTSNDVVMYHGAAKTTTFQSLGNGLYLGYADNFAATAAATPTGIQVKSGRSVYFLGYSFVEKAYHGPVFFGEMPGCSWSGTPHASTSSTTVGTSSLTFGTDPNVLTTAQFSIHIVWKTDYANTHPNNMTFFYDNIDASYYAYFKAADDKIYFTDRTNTISSSAQTFSAGDTLDLIFTAGPNGLNIYKNGANIATGATYTPWVTSTSSNLLFGVANAGAESANGIFRLINTYAVEMTAAQALAVYNSVSGAIAADHPLEPPLLYLSHAYVYNVSDSGHYNYGTVMGVPGNLPADTTLYGEANVAFSAFGAIIISLFSQTNYVNPKNLYGEYDGSADANSSNSAYNAFSLSTTQLNKSAGAIDINSLPEFTGRPVIVLARINDQGANLKYGISYNFGSVVSSSPLKAVVIPGTFSLWLTDSINLPDADSFYLEDGIGLGTATINLALIRSTGTANIQLDWTQMITRPCIRIASTSAADAFVLHGSIAQSYGTVSGASVEIMSTTGDDKIELEPNKYNNLICAMGTQAVNPLTSWYIIFDKIFVTPRWSVL